MNDNKQVILGIELPDDPSCIIAEVETEVIDLVDLSFVDECKFAISGDGLNKLIRTAVAIKGPNLQSGSLIVRFPGGKTVELARW